MGTLKLMHNLSGLIQLSLGSPWCQVILKIYTNIVIFCLKIFFTFTNSVGPDEMQHYAAFHLGLHCLQKYSFCLFCLFDSLRPIKIFQLYRDGSSRVEPVLSYD